MADKPKRLTCDACGKPIKQDSAHVVENMPGSRRAWHFACCPLLKEATP